MRATGSDEIYYRHGMRLPFATRAAIAARDDVFKRFMKLMAPTEATRILDFGVSTTVRDEANILEQLYPWLHRLTCAGIGECPTFDTYYPGVTYRPIAPNAPLPFENKSFDIAFSNAVLEHVGTDQDRAFVIGELQRVAHRVFLAVPNRWFPIEHHTGIPLLHYVPTLFRKAVRGGALDHWSTSEQLSFIGRREVRHFWPTPSLPNVMYAGIGIGPFSSNMVMWT